MGEEKGNEALESFGANFRPFCWRWELFHPLSSGAVPPRQLHRISVAQTAPHVLGVRGETLGPFVRFELSSANKAASAAELFTGWLAQALVTDLNELISLTFILCLPLQLSRVITGNLRVSHLQKGTVKSTGEDIHFSSLLMFVLEGMEGCGGAFPRSTSELCSDHPVQAPRALLSLSTDKTWQPCSNHLELSWLSNCF